MKRKKLSPSIPILEEEDIFIPGKDISIIKIRHGLQFHPCKWLNRQPLTCMVYEGRPKAIDAYLYSCFYLATSEGCAN